MSATPTPAAPAATPAPATPAASGKRQVPAQAAPVPPGLTPSLKSAIKDAWNAPAPAAAPAPEPAATPAKAPDAPATPPAAAAPAEPAAPPATPSIMDKLAPKAKDVAKDAPATPEAPADPFAHLVAPEGLSEKSKANWQTLKTEAAGKIAAAEKKFADAQAKIALYEKASPAEQANAAELQTKLKEAHDRLAMLDLQSAPEFINKFVAPKNQALKEAAEVIAWNDKGSPDLAILLSKSPKDFNAEVAKLTDGMNSMDMTTVQTSLRAAYKTAGDEKAELGRASEISAQIASQTAARQKAEFETVFKEIGVVDGMFEQTEVPATASPEERAQIEDMNAALMNVRPEAEKIAFGRLDPKAASRVAAKAAMFDVHMQKVIPRINSEYQKIVGERNALFAELKAIKGAKSPGQFDGGGASPDAGKTGKMSVAEMARAAFAGTLPMAGS